MLQNQACEFKWYEALPSPIKNEVGVGSFAKTTMRYSWKRLDVNGLRRILTKIHCYLPIAFNVSICVVRALGKTNSICFRSLRKYVGRNTSVLPETAGTRQHEIFNKEYREGFPQGF